MASFLRYGENTSFLFEAKRKVVHMSEVNESTGRVQEMKKFVRYADGARMYSMGLTKFQQLAKDANACYKIGQLVLVNTEILDKYLEAYHITDSSFYR